MNMSKRIICEHCPETFEVEGTGSGPEVARTVFCGRCYGENTDLGGRRTGTIASGARQSLLQTNSVVKRVGLTRTGAATPLATVQLGAAQPLIAHPMQNYATGQRAEERSSGNRVFCGSWACVLLQKSQRDAERALPSASADRWVCFASRSYSSASMTFRRRFSRC